MTPLDAVIPKLEGVQKHPGWWAAKCPAHDDHRQSLSISVGKDDRVLLYCHAGCDPRVVLEQLQLSWGDLFPTKEAADLVIAEYEYRDLDGRLLFVVERRAGKRFLQRRPLADGTWAWNLDGTPRALYRLRKVRDAIAADRYVFVAEGEKDVHTLEGLGFVATTAPGGAGKWRDEYTEQLVGAKVVVLPDNDDPGHDHAIKLMAALDKRVRSFQVIDLPGLPPKGDVTDWVAAGGTAADLKRMVLAAGQVRLPKSSWVRKASEYKAADMKYLWYPRIALGVVTVLAGVQGTSKSYLSLAIAAQLSQGHPLPDGGASPQNTLARTAPVGTLLITYEDDLERCVVPRLQQLGADLDLVRMIDRRDDETGERQAFRAQDIPQLRQVLDDFPECGLIIVDPASSLQVGSGDRADISDHGVRAVLEPLARLASDYDVAVMAVKHLSKDQAQGALYRIGGSVAWTALPRSVLLAGTDPADEFHRGVAHIKCNYSPKARTLDYWLDNRGFRWGGPSTLQAKDLTKVV